MEKGASMLILKFPKTLLSINDLIAALVTCSPSFGWKFLLRHLTLLVSILPIGPIRSLTSLKGPLIRHPPPVPPATASAIGLRPSPPNIVGGSPNGIPFPDVRKGGISAPGTLAPLPPKPASTSKTGLASHEPPDSGDSKLQSLEEHHVSSSSVTFELDVVSLLL
jgi:hypothetical protein